MTPITNKELMVESVIRSVALGRLELSPRLGKRDRETVEKVVSMLVVKDGRCPLCGREGFDKARMILHMKRKHADEIEKLLEGEEVVKEEDKMLTMTFKIPNKLKDELEEVAREMNVSKGEVIRLALERFIEEWRSKRSAGAVEHNPMG